MGQVSKTDRELFREALIEVFAEKYDNALAESDGDVVCSDKHIRAMDEIVARAVQNGQRKNRRKWLITLLVAAALLLSACTVYAYRGEIRGFIEKVYDEYIHVTYRDTDEACPSIKISEFYTLGYVPEGYELVSYERSIFTNRSKWSSNDGSFIVFEQCDLSGANFSMDSEDGDASILFFGEYEAYFWAGDSTVYMWNDGQHAYKIKSSQLISNDELEKIIDNLIIIG